MRLLWQGGQRSHRGRHYTVENARVYDLPDAPPPVLVSGFGPKAIELAAQIGDGYVPRRRTRSDRALPLRGRQGPGPRRRQGLLHGRRGRGARRPCIGCGPTRRCPASWRRSCPRRRTSSRPASWSRPTSCDAGRPRHRRACRVAAPVRARRASTSCSCSRSAPTGRVLRRVGARSPPALRMSGRIPPPRHKRLRREPPAARARAGPGARRVRARRRRRAAVGAVTERFVQAIEAERRRGRVRAAVRRTRPRRSSTTRASRARRPRRARRSPPAPSRARRSSGSRPRSTSPTARARSSS